MKHFDVISGLGMQFRGKNRYYQSMEVAKSCTSPNLVGLDLGGTNNRPPAFTLLHSYIRTNKGIVLVELEVI